MAAYYGLLRISEITGRKHSLKARDMHLAQDRPKVQMRIWTAKNKKRETWPDDLKIDGLLDCKVAILTALAKVHTGFAWCTS